MGSLLVIKYDKEHNEGRQTSFTISNNKEEAEFQRIQSSKPKDEVRGIARSAYYLLTVVDAIALLILLLNLKQGFARLVTAEASTVSDQSKKAWLLLKPVPSYLLIALVLGGGLAGYVIYTTQQTIVLNDVKTNAPVVSVRASQWMGKRSSNVDSELVRKRENYWVPGESIKGEKVWYRDVSLSFSGIISLSTVIRLNPIHVRIRDRDLVRVRVVPSDEPRYAPDPAAYEAKQKQQFEAMIDERVANRVKSHAARLNVLNEQVANGNELMPEDKDMLEYDPMANREQFDDGYTTKTFNGQTVYFFDADQFKESKGVIFDGDRLIMIYYYWKEAVEAERLLQTMTVL